MGQPEVLERQDLKPGRGIVFVDYLGLLGRPLVSRATSSGRLTIFRESLAGIKRRSWFQAAVSRGHLRQFNEFIFETYEEYWRADDLALDSVEAVYAAVSREGMVPVAPLVDLYRDQSVEAAFKKALVLRMSQFFRTLVALKLLSRGGHMVEFIPSAKWEEIRIWVERAGLCWELPVGVTMIQKRKLLFGFSIDWMWKAILIFLPFGVIAGARKITWSSSSPDTSQVGMRVYATDWGFRSEESRQIDWLLDGKELHRDNTLFVIEKPVSKEYRAELARRGYRFVDISSQQAFRCLSWRFLSREILFRGMRAWLKLVFARKAGVFNEVVARGWLEYLRWTAFLEKRRLRHYVTYNHIHFDHVFRNSRLHSVGCETWYYVHSVHDGNPFNLSNPLRSQVDLAYLSYDNEVHWGVRDANYYKGMLGQSRVYRVWGPLWSAHVRQSPQLGALLNQRRSKISVAAVVALFDTSFGPMNLYYGMGELEFFEALIDLLGRPEWSSRLLIYKPKNSLTAVQEVASGEVIAGLVRLAKHPRCLVLEADIDPGVVIAEADLTISIAYTSTTVEALGARRRALFFDPGGKFHDSYYDQFPNMVAHDRETLARLCEHWLRMQDADFQKYLDRYLAPEFGGYLDSGAVARFRAALTCE